MKTARGVFIKWFGSVNTPTRRSLVPNNVIQCMEEYRNQVIEKTVITKDILIKHGFNTVKNLIQEHFTLVLVDQKFHNHIQDKPYYIYKSLTIISCNDKGKGGYYLFMREGDTDKRHDDDVVCITRNLLYEEDLVSFLNIVKL